MMTMIRSGSASPDGFRTSAFGAGLVVDPVPGPLVVALVGVVLAGAVLSGVVLSGVVVSGVVVSGVVVSGGRVAPDDAAEPGSEVLAPPGGESEPLGPALLLFPVGPAPVPGAPELEVGAVGAGLLVVPPEGGTTEQLRCTDRAVTKDDGPVSRTCTGAVKMPSEFAE